MDDSPRIVIVGAGPVGATLALALANNGVATAVLESSGADAASADPRPLALAYGTRLILERLGLWQALGAVTPIEAIHVSQRGGFGRVAMTAAEAGLPALGYVARYARLREVLAAALAQRVPGFTRGVRVTAVKPNRDAAVVEFARDGLQQALATQLVVIAEGGALADVANVRKIDYRQAAVVASIQSELPHRNVAFERFTPGGPLALLPCAEELSLVWTVGADVAQQVCDEPAAQFVRRLSEHFGGRLGRLGVAGGRAYFPLALKMARDIALPRTVLVGNAAQTLHPVAGQGLNLGLRDAWELAAEISAVAPDEIGSPAMLDAYRRRRRIDRGGGIWFTDSLVRVFSNDLAPLRAARGVGLALLGCLPPVKDFIVRRMTFGARG